MIETLRKNLRLNKIIVQGRTFYRPRCNQFKCKTLTATLASMRLPKYSAMYKSHSLEYLNESKDPSALLHILNRYVGQEAILALLLDYDGTLSPIAPHPDLATIPPETKKVLAKHQS